MKLTLTRYSGGKDSTLGLLHVDGFFQCYILEDEERTVKIFGETRIPEGTYDLELRLYGGHHDRYLKNFPDFHVGMIQIMNVPNFRDILIHIGNRDTDTAGCLLTGDTVNNNQIGEGYVGQSKDAYIRLYKKVVKVLKNNPVKIEIKNLYPT